MCLLNPTFHILCLKLLYCIVPPPFSIISGNYISLFDASRKMSVGFLSGLQSLNLSSVKHFKDL